MSRNGWEYIPKQAIFHRSSNLISTLRCCRTHDSRPFCTFARSLVNDEKCDVQFKFGTYYLIMLSIKMMKVKKRHKHEDEVSRIDLDKIHPQPPGIDADELKVLTFIVKRCFCIYNCIYLVNQIL